MLKTENSWASFDFNQMKNFEHFAIWIMYWESTFFTSYSRYENGIYSRKHWTLSVIEFRWRKGKLGANAEARSRGRSSPVSLAFWARESRVSLRGELFNERKWKESCRRSLISAWFFWRFLNAKWLESVLWVLWPYIIEKNIFRYSHHCLKTVQFYAVLPRFVWR